LPCNGIGSQEVVRTIANEANPWRTTEISKVVITTCFRSTFAVTSVSSLLWRASVCFRIS
jgi:hypothetical protein